MKIKINVFYESIDRKESSDIPIDSEKVRTVESIPTSWEPDKSPKKEKQRLNDKLAIYRKKVEALPDWEDKEKFQKALKIAEDFVKKNSSLGEKQLTRMLESKQPQSDWWKEFRKAISLLHNKFDNKESKDLTEEEKINKLEEDYWVKIEKTDMWMYVLHVDKTEYTLSSFDLVEKKIKDLWLEKRKNLEISKEDINKLKSMSNDEFLKYPPEERLKYITKEHANAKTLKENDELTFTFTFDGVYNQDLWRKTTAWQTLPSQVNVVKEWETEYKRRGLKWEFFAQWWKRLIINEWTHISIGKELSKEELEKIQNKNDMIYKAYMWELKKEEIPQEQQKDFFDKNGNLLEKYKLTDKEKERFEKNDDIVKEAIARNIDPKFATLIFENAVKWKEYMDKGRMAMVEDMFTEFDRQVPQIKMWDWSLLENGRYPDELVVRLLSKFWWENWKEIAKEYGLKESELKSAMKRYELNFTWEELPEKVRQKLKEIYNSWDLKDVLILNTIENLSEAYNFKNKVANFLIAAYENYWVKVYQANWKLWWVRTIQDQLNIIKNWGTKVKDPSRSLHTKWLAIDLTAWNDKRLVKLAAKYWLWNGAEMWDWWDPVHFQAYYTWSKHKKQRRIALMERKWTLPVQNI